MAKIALVTTAPTVVSGVTIISRLVGDSLRALGHEVDLVVPTPTVLGSFKMCGQIVTYTLLQDRLKAYDLVMGNGVGLSGTLDLEVPTVDTVHSTSEGTRTVLVKAYEEATDHEKEYLDQLLRAIVGFGWHDLPPALQGKVEESMVDAMVAQKAKVVIAVSEQIRGEIARQWGVADENIATVYNGIDPMWYADRELSPEIDGEGVNIVYTGRAGFTGINIFLKGFDRALRAMETFPEVNRYCILHVGGKTEERIAMYTPFLESRGMKGFFNLDHAGMAARLRKHDIYIHTSRYEAFGLSLTEAMASGLAVVTYPAGIVPECIENGVNGFVVHSEEEMNEVIGRLVADPELRARVGDAARQTVIEKFNMEQMVAGYVDVIARALAA